MTNELKERGKKGQHIFENVKPITTMHCPSEKKNINQQMQGLQALQINIDGQTSINKNRMPSY